MTSSYTAGSSIVVQAYGAEAGVAGLKWLPFGGESLLLLLHFIATTLPLPLFLPLSVVQDVRIM